MIIAAITFSKLNASVGTYSPVGGDGKSPLAPSPALLHVVEPKHNGWTGGKSSRSKKDIADSSSRSAKSLRWRLDGQNGGNGVLGAGVDDDDDDEVAEAPQLLLLMAASIS